MLMQAALLVKVYVCCVGRPWVPTNHLLVGTLCYKPNMSYTSHGGHLGSSFCLGQDVHSVEFRKKIGSESYTPSCFAAMSGTSSMTMRSPTHCYCGENLALGKQKHNTGGGRHIGQCVKGENLPFARTWQRTLVQGTGSAATYGSN